MTDDTQTPTDESVIWRYMSYSRFSQLLNDQAIYLARLDQFSDFNEGSMTRKAKHNSEVELMEQGAIDNVGIVDWFHKHMNQKYWYASCWNASESENNLLWRAYGAPKPGDEHQFKVAIRSTIGGLRKALDNKELKIGRVRYLDYDTEDPFESESSIDSESIIYYKQREYQGENEVRLAYLDKNSMTGGLISKLPDTPKGVCFPVDLNALIDEIYIEAIPVDWERAGINDKEYLASLGDTLNSRVEMIERALLENNVASVEIKLSKIL